MKKQENFIIPKIQAKESTSKDERATSLCGDSVARTGERDGKEHVEPRQAQETAEQTGAVSLVNRTPDNSNKCKSNNGTLPSRRFGLCVGNLNWWTTDEQVEKAVRSCGITDLLEVKFYENRPNGKSKGFCTIQLGTMDSCNVLLEKLKRVQIDEKQPGPTLVLPCNRDTLAFLDGRSPIERISPISMDSMQAQSCATTSTYTGRICTQAGQQKQPNIRQLNDPIQNAPDGIHVSTQGGVPRFPHNTMQQSSVPFPLCGAMRGPPPRNCMPNAQTNHVNMLQGHPRMSCAPGPWQNCMPDAPVRPMPMETVEMRHPPPMQHGPQQPQFQHQPHQFNHCMMQNVAFPFLRPAGPQPQPEGNPNVFLQPGFAPPHTATGCLQHPNGFAAPHQSTPQPGLAPPHQPAPQPGLPLLHQATPQPGAPALHHSTSQPGLSVLHQSTPQLSPAALHQAASQPGLNSLHQSTPQPQPQLSPAALHQSTPHPSPVFLQQIPNGVQLQAQQGHSTAQNDVDPTRLQKVSDTPLVKKESNTFDFDFDAVLQRNKQISSSAIHRAVEDASMGDFTCATETLMTAISLIKQSRIGDDDRCKILVSSLQDTLHCIEKKSEQVKANSSSRDRNRDREYRSRRHHHDAAHDTDQFYTRSRSSHRRSRSRSPIPSVDVSRSRDRSKYLMEYERNCLSTAALSDEELKHSRITERRTAAYGKRS